MSQLGWDSLDGVIDRTLFARDAPRGAESQSGAQGDLENDGRMAVAACKGKNQTCCGFGSLPAQRVV